MTARLGFILSSITTIVFFILMGVFTTIKAPLALSVFAGLITLIAIALIVVSSIAWYEDTKRER